MNLVIFTTAYTWWFAFDCHFLIGAECSVSFDPECYNTIKYGHIKKQLYRNATYENLAFIKFCVNGFGNKPSWNVYIVQCTTDNMYQQHKQENYHCPMTESKIHSSFDKNKQLRYDVSLNSSLWWCSRTKTSPLWTLLFSHSSLGSHYAFLSDVNTSEAA